MGYYDTPSDEIFNDIKQKAKSIWLTYDDTHGYATEKIDQIETITNVKDNWGFIVGMFDWQNQQKLLTILTPEAKALVKEYL
jgi:hypothetical protein